MLNMPVLKFEKSCNYLKDQLQVQENNKQLLLDVIGNVGIISNDSTSEEQENYDLIISSANDLLQTASSNIRTLEHLNFEISSITNELTELLSDANRNSKGKEFYITAFSNLKNSITQYTEKFKNIETKLVVDNVNFNQFIRDNNLKYTFDSFEVDSDGSTKTNYQFTGFYINDEVALDPTRLPEIPSCKVTPAEAEKNKKINALTNEFKNLLVGLSADNLTNIDLTSFLNSYVNQLSNNDIEVKETITGARKDDLTEIIGFVKGSVQEELTQALDETVEPTSVNTDVLKEVTSEITAKPQAESHIFDEYEQFDTSSLTKFKPLHKSETVKQESVVSAVAVETSSTGEVVVEETQEVEETIDTDDIELTDEDILDLDISEEGLNTLDISDESEVNLLDEILLESIMDEDFSDEDIVDESDNVSFKEEVQKTTMSIEEKIELIQSAESDNETLVISERTNSIYLPYKVSELIRYAETYPNVYSSLADVVEQEFILPFDYFMKHPFKSRFFETYNLIRNRQGKSVTHAVTAGLKLIYKHNLNPAIIAACKTEHELNSYLYYLDNKNLKGFKFFNIHYDINPL